MTNSLEIKSNIIDIVNRNIYPALLRIQSNKIVEVIPIEEKLNNYLLPGFIDAHIHIESSMLSPSAFSCAATPFGTVATVSDPHEIANVCGKEGVMYMIEDAKKAALKFHFGAPSCVPATSFETAGAQLNADDIYLLMQHPDIYYLAEMMNFPGVLHNDPEIMAKIEAAKRVGKPIDGHAPGLRAEQAKQYIAAGISTDHECTSIEEALDKIKYGMKILIREGSAAKNFDALVPLFTDHAKQLMFCSDDKHPDELIKGHINQLVARAVALGYDLFDVLYAACIAPIAHYNLKVGQLKIGDDADFIIVKDLINFEVSHTYINGKLVAENGKSLETFETPKIINQFDRAPVSEADFKIQIDTHKPIVEAQVISAIDGQLITKVYQHPLQVIDNIVQNDVENDISKIAVVNRYKPAPISMAFIKNFGLQKGAIASSVAHDSHNIVVVGTNDAAMMEAVNCIIEKKGGISVYDEQKCTCFPLPIAGLMTTSTAQEAAKAYEELDKIAKTLGSGLKAPYMTLSFMALPVIPSLKITDKGLFNVDSFNFTSIF